MNRKMILGCVMVLALYFLITPAFHARAAINSTPVCGLITSDTTWSASNSPYDVCVGGATVDSNATLTIEPGVTVQFESGLGDKLNVLGTINAVGTDTQPITLTAVVQNPGSWEGISANGSSVSPAIVNLVHVRLEYGGNSGSFGAQIYADHAGVTIDHSLIRYGVGYGLYASTNANFDVQNTAFISNAHEAVFLNTPSVDLLMANLSASGNGGDGIRIAGTTTWPGQRQWTNPGIPYIVDGQMSNSPGDVLTIDPGSVLKFTSTGFLNIGGVLKALGSANDPIILTGQIQSNGSWRGIVVSGGSQPAAVQLNYVTVEYGGSDVNGANVEITNGTLSAQYSLIRNSAKDGLRLDSNASASILNSQIYGNGLYGIYNAQPTQAVLATNNWWGDAGGPRSDIAQCSSGLGDKVTAGVLFIPVLNSQTASNILPLSDAPNLTLTPRRWFSPADGITRIYFDIRLTDGNGAPLPGRTIRLHSTLGTVTDGGVTDAQGNTLAYLTSTSTGDTQVHATLDPLTACEGSLSPDAKVTFTTPVAFVDLMPNSAAPYYDPDLTVAPLPVITGITTTISARLTNPLTTSVTTNVEFGFAQAGIGLVFGPIKDYTGVVIPPGGIVTLTAQFVPSVSGHYCVQVSYDIVRIGALGAVTQAKQLKQFNLNVQQSSTSSSGKQANLDKTRTSLKNVNRFVGRAYDTGPITLPLAVANQGIEWDLNNAEKISNALNGDPPRQDYTLITSPVVLQLPLTLPGNGVSPARANALNAVDTALAQANAYGTAAAIALDRSGGATGAGDLSWASIQTGVMLQYNQLMGEALITAAQDIDALIAVAANEGVTSVPITVEDAIAMQQKLAGGWSAAQVSDAHTIGLTDADLENLRQNILAANPAELAGDVIVNMHQVSAQFYLLGAVLSNPAAFNPGYSVGAGVGQAQAVGTGNTMVQVFGNESSFLLSNPFTTPAQVSLNVRRIGLPADWSVVVSPVQVNLDPGQQVTVTVNVIPGSPVAQGSQPRLAVEGYANDILLGGMVINILVPTYRPYDGHWRVYLPVIGKR